MFQFFYNLKSLFINKVMSQQEKSKGIVIKKSLEEIHNDFVNDIRIANEFSFQKEPITDSAFWKGKGITVDDDKNQCVLHTKTNLVFKMTGEVIGLIDEEFNITLVDDLSDRIKEWIEYQSLKVYREEDIKLLVEE
jgi:hypothetical protein